MKPDRQVLPAAQDLQAQQALLEKQVQPDLLVQQDRQVLPAAPEQLALQEELDRQVLLDQPVRLVLQE